MYDARVITSELNDARNIELRVRGKRNIAVGISRDEKTIDVASSNLFHTRALIHTNTQIFL